MSRNRTAIPALATGGMVENVKPNDLRARQILGRFPRSMRHSILILSAYATKIGRSLVPAEEAMTVGTFTTGMTLIGGGLSIDQLYGRQA
jgi:hypothetical protein